MSKSKPPGYWTEERVREEAKKYGSRKEFKTGASAAYKCAVRLGILADLLPTMFRQPWTEDRVREEAALYKTKNEFNTRCQSGYEFARRLGILDDLFVCGNRTWNNIRVREEAKKYRSKSEFQLLCFSAYSAARRLGILDDLGFVPGDTSDNDTIYIWRAVGCTFNGNPVFKIGVTSQRLGTRRIKKVARAAGLEYELICCEPVLGKATDLEKKLHMLGEDPEMSGFDGATEFRALNKSALDAALSIIKANQ